jgi:hypothetical protein
MKLSRAHKILLMAVISLIGGTSFAANAKPNSNQATIATTIPAVPSSKWTGSLLYQVGTMINTDDTQNYSGLYHGTLGYSHEVDGGTWSVSLGFGFHESYMYEGSETADLYAGKLPEGETGDWVDPILSLKRSFKAKSVDTYSFGLSSSIAGASRQSVLEKRIGSLGFVGSYSVAAKGLGMPWLTWTQGAGYRYAIYREDIQADGRVNPLHRIRNTGELVFDLGKGFSSSLTGIYDYNVNQQSTVKTISSGNIELAYDLNQMSFAIGVSNDSSGLSVDGLKYEVNLTGAESASAYFSFGLKI